MKRIAILLENLFDEKEFIFPYYRLLEEDYQVDIIGKAKDTIYTSKSGLKMKSDLSSAEANPEDYDAVVIPGGFSPDYMRRTPATVEFVKELDAQKKPIAAICHGPWMMISACDIQDRNITGFFSIKDDIENAGASYVDEAVVIDGNYITSRTPKDLPIFVKTIIQKLNQ